MTKDLTSADLIKRSSVTYQRFTRLTEEADLLYQKYKKAHEFDIAMTNALQFHKSMSQEQFDQACALFHHCPNMTASEIIEEIYKNRD